MLDTRRFLAAAFLLGVGTMSLAACGRATLNAGPASTDVPAMTTSATPPPNVSSPSAVRPFPAEAYQNLVPTHLPGILSCQQPRRPVIDADPGVAPPQSLAALTHASALVVLAKAVQQKSYWHWAGPHQSFDGWLPMTATLFSVEQVLKGSSSPNLTLVEQGARPGTLPCDALSYVYPSDPLTKNSEEYVLFLQSDGSLGDNMWRMAWAPFYRFDVVGGVVRFEYPLPGYSPESVATFASQVRAAAQ
jgi:hypothetical protein